MACAARSACIADRLTIPNTPPAWFLVPAVHPLKTRGELVKRAHEREGNGTVVFRLHGLLVTSRPLVYTQPSRYSKSIAPYTPIGERAQVESAFG